MASPQKESQIRELKKATDQPTVNITQLKELRDMTGPARLDILLQQFFQYIEDSINQIQAAVASEDPEQIELATHGRKGIYRNVGTNGLASVCVALEKQTELNSNEQTSHDMSELNHELQNVEAIMQEHLFLTKKI